MSACFQERDSLVSVTKPRTKLPDGFDRAMVVTSRLCYGLYEHPNQSSHGSGQLRVIVPGPGKHSQEKNIAPLSQRLPDQGSRGQQVHRPNARCKGRTGELRACMWFMMAGLECGMHQASKT